MNKIPEIGFILKSVSIYVTNHIFLKLFHFISLRCWAQLSFFVISCLFLAPYSPSISQLVIGLEEHLLLCFHGLLFRVAFDLHICSLESSSNLSAVMLKQTGSRRQAAIVVHTFWASKRGWFQINNLKCEIF